jgi:hypothetical protein
MLPECFPRKTFTISAMINNGEDFDDPVREADKLMQKSKFE